MNNFTAANTSLRNVSLKAVSETQDELNALCCLKPSAFCCVFPFVSKGQFEDENLVFNVYSAHRNTCDMLPYSSQSFANPQFSFCSFESLKLELFITKSLTSKEKSRRQPVVPPQPLSRYTYDVSFSVTSCRKYGV